MNLDVQWGNRLHVMIATVLRDMGPDKEELGKSSPHSALTLRGFLMNNVSAIPWHSLPLTRQ